MIEPIKRGSFLITDAFAAALAFTDLNITKSVPILMPIWSPAAGHHISGIELGLTNGTIDPNMLMAQVLSKHWLNLTRHASKYRNSNDANGPGGFSEQAFIKALKRVTVTDNFSAIESIPKSVNGNTLTMLSHSEDLLTRKIILTLNANDTNAVATCTIDKPSYLVTNELPLEITDFMINSQEKALYDRNSEFYNLTPNECRRFTFTAGVSRTFDFNAILVYFDNDGAEDLGGIYFVDKYEQNGAFWEIPKTAKHENNTFSYDINMISNGAKVLQWTAENSDLPAALLLYEDLFRERVSMLQQMTQLQQQNVALTAQVQSINNLLTMTNVNQLQVLANTLSAINVNDKAALVTAAISLAYDNQIQNDFEVPVAVGNYQAGDVIPAGTNINDILSNIFI
jgi:hypothetical protein